MAIYFLKKILYGILVAWGVITVVFLLFHVLPGDPARMMVGQRADQATLERIREEMGLNRPMYQQYLHYLNDLSFLSLHDPVNHESYFYLDPGEYGNCRVLIRFSDARALVLRTPYLGRSFQSRERVGQILGTALPNTFLLAACSMLFAFIIGTAAGIFAAIRKDGVYDRSILVISSLGMSLPSFFAAILIGWLFAYKLQDFTGLNLTGNILEVDEYGEGVHLQLKNLLLPAITLGIRPLSVVVQLSRNSMLDVLSQDYIRTARAKGLSFSRIIFGHALKNSMNPLVTAVSGWFASLMAGVIFVEYIFGWKGLGYVIVNALNNYDFPLVLGSVILISLIFVVINILVDLIYAYLDPKDSICLKYIFYNHNYYSIMRKQIIAGNWKMNKTLQEGIELAKSVNEMNEKIGGDVGVIVAPPFIHLSEVSRFLTRVGLSAQDCAAEASGAFTGEVSAGMVRSAGAEYVIIGHSERRTIFGEDDAMLNKKVIMALENGLIPIFCCGEVLEERESGKLFEVVKTQIEVALFNLDEDNMGKIIIAYEPVWAIGTGVVATPGQAQEMHAYIRKLVRDKFGDSIADDLTILYGGSCKPSNAREIFANPDVDGGLIGGASLNAEDFIAIVQSF